MSTEFEGGGQFPIPPRPDGAPQPMQGQVTKPQLKPENYTGPILDSCRCDQEAFQDSNLIRQSLLKADAGFKAYAQERALKFAALLLIPLAFFAGIWLSMATRDFFDHGVHPSPVAVGFIAGLVSFAAMAPTLLATKTAQRIIERAERRLFE